MRKKSPIIFCYITVGTSSIHPFIRRNFHDHTEVVDHLTLLVSIKIRIHLLRSYFVIIEFQFIDIFRFEVIKTLDRFDKKKFRLEVQIIVLQ